MKKILWIGTVVIAIGLLLLQAQFGVSGRAKSAAAIAQGASVVVRVPSPKEPVEVTKLRVGESDISFGNPFAGGEDWVNAFSCEVKNTSDKAIAELRMSVSFNAGGVKPRKISIPLTYKGLVQPNRTVRVLAPNTNIASLRSSLAKQGLAANFSKGELRMQLAKFEDGSLWVKGVKLGAKDPRTGRRRRM